MNPVDHPMGGGEGKASGGHPRSRNGLYSKGLKTRKKNKYSDRLIVKKENKMARSLKKDHILILDLEKKLTKLMIAVRKV